MVVILNSTEKIEFKKSYSRDTTLFMQELWAKGLTTLPKEKFGWENPFLPFIAHHVNDGVVEIWEHKKAIEWFLDRLLEENTNNPKFLEKLLSEYKELLKKLNKFHKKDILLSDTEKADYINLVYNTAFIMTIFFYTGMDERNPQVAKDTAVQARKEGDFFAENDVFARKNISKIGNIPAELAGVVLPEEITNIPTQDILQKRLESFLLIDGLPSHTGPLAEFEKNNSQYIFLNSKGETSPKEVRGQVAYPGHVRGIVRIVKKQSHIQNVKEGDILVAPMTTPDFLMAMNMAGAFITDEGGVTCHGT